MFFQLSNPAPVEKELLPAIGDRPAVKVTFNPQPSPMSLRFGRRAVAEIMRAGLPDAIERAGDAFSREIVRHNMLAWSGIFDGETELQPTPDEFREEDGEQVLVKYGTISAFLSEPRLMQAADREYVLPWSMLDAEKNGLAPSLNGTSAGATAESDTASSSAIPDTKADATPAPTKFKRRKPTRAKVSGS